MGLEDLLPLAGPRWDGKQPCLPKQVFFAHIMIYFYTPSDTFFFTLFASHILASILADEYIFKPAIEDSVDAANRLRAGRSNMRRRHVDQDGGNHKSASGGVLESG